MLRVGIIGLGKQGRNHAQRLWLAPEFQVTHVYEHTRGSAPIADLNYAQSVEALCGAVDLVVIATPSATHFKLAEQALLASKHVVVEKPTTLSLSDTRRLIALAEERNVALLTHFNRRWDPDFLIVKETLAKGLLGSVHTIESRVSDNYDCSGTYPTRAAWKKQSPGGGILLDWAPHLFDQLFEFFPNESPQALFCHTARPNGATETGVEEQFSITVFYHGRSVVLTATWNAALPMPRWFLVGSSGALRIDPEKTTKGYIRFRYGTQVTEEAAYSNGKPDGFKDFALGTLQRPEARSKEGSRMLNVAKAIDLARHSANNKTCLRWTNTDSVDAGINESTQ